MRGTGLKEENEETEEIKNIYPLPLPTARIAGLVQMSANTSWTPSDAKYTTSLPHQTTP